jgi:hypothetical protein
MSVGSCRTLATPTGQGSTRWLIAFTVVLERLCLCVTVLAHHHCFPDNTDVTLPLCCPPSTLQDKAASPEGLSAFTVVLERLCLWVTLLAHQCFPDTQMCHCLCCPPSTPAGQGGVTRGPISIHRRPGTLVARASLCWHHCFPDTDVPLPLLLSVLPFNRTRRCHPSLSAYTVVVERLCLCVTVLAPLLP